ncbi:MAG: DNA polymerase III subunit gamma/tau [Chlorobiaceae bacterium]|nr:DNA polymerase III subunit gamma/tau [Chlorobiaceae bacterium]
MPARSKSAASDSAAEPSAGQPVAVLEQLRMEWGRFLEHLSAKGLQVMVSHLHASELMACSPQGLVELGCCRKFSYEELFHDADLLAREMADFYKLPLRVTVRYDAARDACTREKSLFTMFQELSESNEVVRYLIQEFGGELVY